MTSNDQGSADPDPEPDPRFTKTRGTQTGACPLEGEPLRQINRTFVRVRGRKFAYFGGCDYFRMASNPRVMQAVRRGLARDGLNTAASRLTTGNHPVYRELERALAVFFGAEDALLLSSGYQGSAAVAQALAGSFSHALIDARAHVSVLDGARFLDCPIVRFEHRSVLDLEKAVRRIGRGSRLIVLTDGMFSHDGSMAPLAEYLRVLPTDAVLVVDDAHAAGVMGKAGRGTPEYTGVPRDRIVQLVTLSKAFGAYGGAVLCDQELRSRIVSRSHLFGGGTPLPPPLARGALEALRVLRRCPILRKRLHENAARVKDALDQAGCRVCRTPGPIVNVVPGSDDELMLLRKMLARAAIHAPLICYPGGPANGYFRFVISSEHTPRQLESLVKVLTRFFELRRDLRVP